jgi:hypothetical protein
MVIAIALAVISLCTNAGVSAEELQNRNVDIAYVKPRNPAFLAYYEDVQENVAAPSAGAIDSQGQFEEVANEWEASETPKRDVTAPLNKRPRIKGGEIRQFPAKRPDNREQLSLSHCRTRPGRTAHGPSIHLGARTPNHSAARARYGRRPTADADLEEQGVVEELQSREIVASSAVKHVVGGIRSQSPGIGWENCPVCEQFTRDRHIRRHVGRRVPV